MKELIYYINQERYSLTVEGNSFIGRDNILLLEDDDLTLGTSWHRQGYIVSDSLPLDYYESLVKNLTDVIQGSVEKILGKKIKDFFLENYHYYVNDNEHVAVVHELQAQSAITCFPLSYQVLDQEVSKLCQKELSCFLPNNIFSGRFFIRIIRPNSRDYNPPHRDVWLDHLRNAVNMYLPLAGSGDNSNLSLIPNSHHWKESELERTVSGATVNGTSYRVPSVIGSVHGLYMIRPRVDNGQFLLFSPYLVHGGAINNHPNKTRVSLEMRFWRSK